MVYSLLMLPFLIILDIHSAVPVCVFLLPNVKFQTSKFGQKANLTAVIKCNGLPFKMKILTSWIFQQAVCSF